jgi:hypothetical protein
MQVAFKLRTTFQTRCLSSKFNNLRPSTVRFPTIETRFFTTKRTEAFVKNRQDDSLNRSSVGTISPNGNTPRMVEELPKHSSVNTGTYLKKRLEQLGVRSYFTVPGDFTLSLLDELLKSDQLKMISCCNELNAGYAADGYCRSSGQLGVAIVTYCVGGLSIINAVAGSYSEDLPFLMISGTFLVVLKFYACNEFSPRRPQHKRWL